MTTSQGPGAAKEIVIAAMVVMGQAAYETVENLKKILERNHLNIQDFCQGVDKTVRVAQGIKSQGPAQDEVVKDNTGPSTPKR